MKVAYKGLLLFVCMGFICANADDTDTGQEFQEKQEELVPEPALRSFEEPFAMTSNESSSSRVAEIIDLEEEDPLVESSPADSTKQDNDKAVILKNQLPPLSVLSTKSTTFEQNDKRNGLPMGLLIISVMAGVIVSQLLPSFCKKCDAA